MASIFLSYSHEDRKRAERIAKSLESAGHQVWWDQHIRAGSRFSKDINEALKRSDVVVVLWSKASVESVWVQDEAGHGRDNGRLVPVLIDKIDPPLGFRQYHAISYGRSGTSAVVDAVQATLSGAEPAVLPVVKKSRRNWRLWAPLAALILVVVSVAGWWAYRQATGTSQLALVIEPATGTNSPAAREIVQYLIDDLSQFKAGPISALQIRPSGSNGTAAYNAQVRFAEDERQVSVEVVLNARDGRRLWSTSLQGQSNQQAELAREAAGRLGAALDCDLDKDLSNYDLADDVRVSYLEGCARLADASDKRDDQAINALRQVTQKAPKFAPGWAHLALAEWRAVPTAPSGEKSNMAWTAGRHTDVARRLDPSLPEPYYVAAFNGPFHPGKMAKALGTIDEGLRHSPDSALLFDARASILANLGLLSEALGAAKRAIALDPLSPAYLGNYVLMLVYNGQVPAARLQLEQAQHNWPRSAAIVELQYGFDLRYGDPANAQRLLREGSVPGNANEGLQLYLQARLSPAPANIAALLSYYRMQFEKDPTNSFGYLQALGNFNRVDEAYRVLAKPEAIEPFTHDGEGLFRPYMRGIRNDPRFMGVAHRAGLLAFWRKSGDWPDFCRDPQLPYDCQKEAAKYPV